MARSPYPLQIREIITIALLPGLGLKHGSALSDVGLQGCRNETQQPPYQIPFIGFHFTTVTTTPCKRKGISLYSKWESHLAVLPTSGLDISFLSGLAVWRRFYQQMVCVD